MDNNDIFLQTATESIYGIGVKYRRANFNDKQKLRQERDKAFSAYSIARLKLLEDEVLCQPEDIAEMYEIRQEIATASTTQILLVAIARLTRILLAL